GSSANLGRAARVLGLGRRAELHRGARVLGRAAHRRPQVQERTRLCQRQGRRLGPEQQPLDVALLQPPARPGRQPQPAAGLPPGPWLQPEQADPPV
ncbi:hypothetical protein IWQ56_006291, partial [Coemansia nantahalensis]